ICHPRGGESDAAYLTHLVAPNGGRKVKACTWRPHCHGALQLYIPRIVPPINGGVAPHLTVVIGATSDLGFGSLPWTPSWLLWLPPLMPSRPLWLRPWRRNLEGKQFINRPTMICNATRHRRCSFKPLVATGQSRQPQAFMLRAEVVDTTNKVHSRLQG